MSDTSTIPESMTSALAVEAFDDLSAKADDVTGDTECGAPEESPPACVDWDHKGRVIRTRYSDGHICQFRYDENGSLYGFVYGRLAWSSNDGFTWSAQDSINLYVTQGHMTVNVDGTLRIDRESFTRTLRLDGMLVDEYPDGLVIENMRTGVEQKPADLFAEVYKKSGVPTTTDFSVAASQSGSEAVKQSTFTERAFVSGANETGNLERANAVAAYSSESGTRLRPDFAVAAMEPATIPETQSLSQSFAKRSGTFFRPQLVGLAPGLAEASEVSGAGTPPPSANDNENCLQSETQEGSLDSQTGSTRRPLAVGKRIKRLRVLDESTSQAAASGEIGKVTARESVRLAWEELRLSVLEKLFGRQHAVLLPSLDALAELYYHRRRVNDARETHERALSIRWENLGAMHADTSINLHGLGRIYHEWGRYTEAEEQYAQAIKVSGKGLQKARFMRESGITDDAHILEHIQRLLSAVHSLAKLYSEQQRRHLCVELLRTARNVKSSLDDSYHKHFEQVFDSLNALASPGHDDAFQEPAAYMKKAKAVSSAG